MDIIFLKVWLGENPEVYRELALPENFTYEQLHLILIKVFGIEQRMPASFFESNKRWQKLKEIAVDQHRILEGSKDGAEHQVAESFNEGVEQLVYFNDATTHITYHMQFIKKAPKEESVVYPKLLTSKGKIVRGFGEGIFDEELDWDDDLDTESGGFTEDNV